MESGLSPAHISQFYAEAFQRYDSEKKTPPVSVNFYPYVGINHTIRLRKGIAHVRISEICRDMPAEAQKALAYILVSKLYGRRAPKWADRTYSEFIEREHIRERSAESKRVRGRKLVSGTKGKIYDLDEVFDTLNEYYFQGNLRKPVLTWSARKTYRMLGHHDSAHDTIVISRSLDSEDTPRFVLDYIVFHEMLHVFHPTVHHNGRRYNHTPEFRRDEEKFRYYTQAEDWIERNVHKLKRRAKR